MTATSFDTFTAFLPTDLVMAIMAFMTSSPPERVCGPRDSGPKRIMLRQTSAGCAGCKNDYCHFVRKRNLRCGIAATGPASRIDCSWIEASCRAPLTLCGTFGSGGASDGEAGGAGTLGRGWLCFGAREPPPRLAGAESPSPQGGGRRCINLTDVESRTASAPPSGRRPALRATRLSTSPVLQSARHRRCGGRAAGAAAGLRGRRRGWGASPPIGG